MAENNKHLFSHSFCELGINQHLARWFCLSFCHKTATKQSSCGLNGGGSASKLTPVALAGLILATWASSQSSLTIWQLISPRESSPSKRIEYPGSKSQSFINLISKITSCHFLPYLLEVNKSSLCSRGTNYTKTWVLGIRDCWGPSLSWLYHIILAPLYPWFRFRFRFPWFQ